jgi:hypothetical protein
VRKRRTAWALRICLHISSCARDQGVDMESSWVVQVRRERMRREGRAEDWSERAEVGCGARTFEVLGVVVECGVSTVRVVVLS